MTQSAGSLEIQLFANVARIADDMNKAKGHVNGAMEQINRSVDTVKRAIGALGIAFGAREFVEFGRSMLDNADQLGKMAQRTGVGIETLSRFSVAAKLADVDTESLGTGLGKLGKSISDANYGLSTQVRAFQSLGISIRDAHGNLKNTDQILLEMSDKFASMPDGAKKTAAAMDLMGRAGAGLIPMLNGGSEEMRKFAQMSDELGVTMDQSTSQAAQDVNDRFTVMGMAFTGVKNQVLKELLPSLTALSQEMVKGSTDSQSMKMAIDGISASFKVLLTAVVTTKTAVDELFLGLRTFADVSVAIMHGDFQAAADAARENKHKMVAEMQTGADTVLKIWEDNSKQVAKIQEETKKKQTVSGGVDFGTAAATAKYEKQLATEQSYFDQVKAKMIQASGDQEAILQQQYQMDVNAWLIKYEAAKKNHALSRNEEQQFQQALVDLQAAYAQQRVSNEVSVAGMLRSVRQGDYNNALSMAQQMTAGLAQHNRTMFEINKAASIARATVNTYQAASNAFEQGSQYSYWLGVAMAAAATAFGLAQVDAIASTSFGGGGGGAVTAGGGIPSAASTPGIPVNTGAGPGQSGKAAAPSTTVNVTIQGAANNPDAPVMSYNQVTQLIDQINQAGENGHTIKLNATAA